MDLYSRLYPRDIVSGPSPKCSKCPLAAVRNTVGVDNVFGRHCEFHRVDHAERVNEIKSCRRASLLCVRCGAPVERKINGTLYDHCRDHRLEKQRLTKAAAAKRKFVMQNGGKRPTSFAPTVVELRIITEH